MVPEKEYIQGTEDESRIVRLDIRKRAGLKKAALRSNICAMIGLKERALTVPDIESLLTLAQGMAYSKEFNKTITDLSVTMNQEFDRLAGIK